MPAGAGSGRVLASQELRAAIERRVDQRRRLPDPARGDAAGEHRPAARRLRLGPALLASCPTSSRRSRRSSTDIAFQKIDLRDGATLERDRPYLIPLIEELALPDDDPREGEPEELDRAPRRLHPRDHRPPPPLRRDPPRLPRAALPRGRAALVRDLRAPGPGAEPAAAVDAATRASTTRSSSRLHQQFPLLYVDQHPLRETELAIADGLFLSVDLRSGPGDRVVGYRAKKNSLPIDLEPDSRLPLERLLGSGPSRGGLADRARAGDLLPAAVRRGGLHPARVRGRDDGLRPDRRRAAHPLRRLLRPRLRLRRRQRPPRQPRRARGPRPRRPVHGRAPPADLQARLRAHERDPGRPLRRGRRLQLPGPGDDAVASTSGSRRRPRRRATNRADSPGPPPRSEYHWANAQYRTTRARDRPRDRARDLRPQTAARPRQVARLGNARVQGLAHRQARRRRRAGRSSRPRPRSRNPTTRSSPSRARSSPTTAPSRGSDPVPWPG